MFLLFERFRQVLQRLRASEGSFLTPLRFRRLLLAVCLLLAVSLPVSCFFWSGDKHIAVGAKPFNENILLAEMLAQLTEAHTKIKVERKFNLNSTLVAFDALKSGAIDLYPEYTGTGLATLLGQPTQRDAAKAYETVQTAFNKQFQLKWLKPYGFNNTYAIAVTAELAKAHNLQKISDLSPYASSLVFAANQDFYMSADGFNGLVQTYGITFKDKRQLDIDPKYEAIADGRVDVINAFATDGSLIAHKLVVLTDDKDYFTDYQGTTLVRMDTLRKYPELEPVLNKLADQLSDADMQRLNYQIDQEKRPIAEVARNFLTSKGLLPVKKQAK